MPKKVRIGLIGCGGIMGMHVDQLAPVKAAAIVGLADTSAAMLARFKGRYPHLADLPTFPDYHDLLDEVEMDGVIIATPHTLHYEHIMTSLGRGLHVLAEKPMVCTVQHAKAVIRKAKTKGLILMLAYQRHFFPAFRAARQLIADGKIGKVTYIAALQGQEWLRGTRGAWRQNPALSGGGQLNDSASHLLDIILWVSNLAPASVYAQIDNRGTRVDINSGLTVRFQGGALASIAVVGDAPSWWEDVTYYGEKGALYIRGNRVTLQIPSKGWGAQSEDVTEGLRYQGNADKNFVDSILGRDEPQTPPIWGLRVIQLTEAAWASARTGKPAKIKR